MSDTLVERLAGVLDVLESPEAGGAARNWYHLRTICAAIERVHPRKIKVEIGLSHE